MRRRAFLVSALLACMTACAVEVEAPRDEVPASLTPSRGRELGFSGSAVFLKSWRWHDIVAHLGELRAMNFTAILISPHTATCGGDFSEGYDPSDLTKFWSRFGTEGDLAWLVRSAHDTGLQVYANMVMNHMCAKDYRYDRFGWNDFHHYGQVQSWSDPWWLENGDLFGLNDLCHECDYVRGELFNYLVKTNDLGFDGYRFDAAKHVPSWYWRDHVMNNLGAWGKYAFGEVYDGNADSLGHFVGDTGMSVTDYSLYFAMKEAFQLGGDLRRLDGAGYAMRNGARALTFVENHDVGPPANRDLAYAFLAAYPGYPLFHDPRLGDPFFTNLAWVHNNKAHGVYRSRWAEHDVLIFEREGNLLAGFNQSGAWQSRWVDTSWPNRKLHDFGGATGDVWTAGDGRVQVSIPPVGYVLLGPD